MRIVFISEVDVHGSFKNLGVMCLSAMLKAHRHQVRLFHAEDPNLEREVLTFAPQILAYSVTTGTEAIYLELNRRLRGVLPAGVHSLFGGPHPTFFPELVHEPGVDMICRGEGEEALLELVERMEAGRDWRDVANFWFKDEAGVIQNPCRPLTADLDELPFPDRRIYKHIPNVIGNIEFVMASRGCPFDCSYCFNHQLRELYGKNLMRVRSVDNVIAELASIRYYNKNINFFFFIDDLFPVKTEWLREFKQKYLELINVPFGVNCRANLVKDENVRLLKEAGCHSITMAIESGNDATRNDILCRAMSREAIVQAAATVKRHGIFLLTQNILGNPVPDSYRDACDSLDLNVEVQADFAWSSLLNPYYGTKIWQYCLDKGYVDESVKFPPSYYADTPLRLADKERIRNLQALFALMVGFPFLARHRDVLTRLPLLRLYLLLGRAWKGYKYMERHAMKGLGPWRILGLACKYMLRRGW
ncbi:2-hydroxyethylphosphonate methyltransferase [Fundidesulfovibrio magnetotacticus]|uniref:2-hydroxyethylphosphonate methyltransferase n=1 Tax=Fundidesulfovibrio magnetotacticus TaxID=2730080 RepID=A0A6V8LUA6_9BACT|nr:radical SAM protein [Fundidesulfovibrio magnetotacticus]GFK94171.1 2-hydroxyethylphosphonate methyltransferase [Fundidesulfovibrio magnetotacticus]